VGLPSSNHPKYHLANSQASFGPRYQDEVDNAGTVSLVTAIVTAMSSQSEASSIVRPNAPPFRAAEHTTCLHFLQFTDLHPLAAHASTQSCFPSSTSFESGDHGTHKYLLTS